MSISITPIDTSVDAFTVWVAAANTMIDTFARTVTVNTHANGDLTTGNGWVEGTFGATNLTANTLRGGTVQTPNVLYISSNLNVNVSSKIVCGVVTINSSDIAISGTPLSTSISSLSKFTINVDSTSATIIDFWDKTAYRGAEYVITVKDRNANAYELSKILAVHDSGNAYITEYGVVETNTALATYSANANNSHIRLYIIATPANTYISGTRLNVDI